ncbi:MAG TPA: response regulator, partial [Spirochaetia bacterium]|nr:response regulator [Spirochaetia bacterium]
TKQRSQGSKTMGNTEVKTVLIIEDNPMNMELAGDLLEMAGFRVLSSDTATAGMRLAMEKMPDVILMDIALPDMDGLTATRRLKEDPELRHIPVVALTAHAMSGDEAKALEAGCDGYITKPIDTRSFAKSVEEVLARNSIR